MSQPKWELVCNLGDVNPVEHGGYFIYKDTTGVYGFEADKLDAPEDCDVPGATWQSFRVLLERQKLVRDGNHVYLVPFAYKESWTHPVSQYPEWYVESLDKVADSMGTSRIEIETALCSEDPAQLAWAYQCIGDYHGWANLDHDYRMMTKKEVKKHFKEVL